jgi:hypothetical protein
MHGVLGWVCIYWLRHQLWHWLWDRIWNWLREWVEVWLREWRWNRLQDRSRLWNRLLLFCSSVTLVILLLNPSLVMAICIFDDGKYIGTVSLCKVPVRYIRLERGQCFDMGMCSELGDDRIRHQGSGSPSRSAVMLTPTLAAPTFDHFVAVL